MMRPNATQSASLRLAHLTDTHLQPERAGAEGFANCLNHLQDLNDKPQLILFGGDNVMNVDSAKNTGERADVQINLWKKVLKEHCKLPHKSCIGNHDILGLKQDTGKDWAVKQFNLPSRYYSFDQSGWHIVVLDSQNRRRAAAIRPVSMTSSSPGLKKISKYPTTPVLVLSHIPIITVTSFFDGNNEKTGNWVIPGSWMHIDARRIKDLFAKHANVKLCLSGHEHLVDKSPITTRPTAAMGPSARWWKGSYHECAPATGWWTL